MVAVSEEAESAGNDEYQDDHMGAIFKEGFSFSGFERDLLSLNPGTGEFLNVSGVSGVDSTSAGIQTKIKAGGSGFLSQHDPRLLFGLGRDSSAEWLEVTWPTGDTERFEDVAVPGSLRIVEGRGDYRRVAEQRFSLVDPLDPYQTVLAKLEVGKGDAFPDLALRSLDPEYLRNGRGPDPDLVPAG